MWSVVSRIGTEKLQTKSDAHVNRTHAVGSPIGKWRLQLLRLIGSVESEFTARHAIRGPSGTDLMILICA